MVKARAGAVAAAVLTSGSDVDLVEVGPDGTLFFGVRTLEATGDQVARLYALAPGAAAPTVAAEFATPGKNEQIADLAVASDGTVYLHEGSSVPTGGTGVSTNAVYRLAPGGSPQLIRSAVAGSPTPRPVYVGLDANDNLIVGERRVEGMVRPGCATSTTFQLVRYDATSLAGPAPVGSVYSSATYPGFVWLLVGSSSYFRVSDDGDVLFGLYPRNTRCSEPPGPVTFTSLELRGVAGDDPSGTQTLVIEDVPSPPVAATGYSMAVLKNHAFATWARVGRLVGFTLKVKKKPK